MTNYEKYFGTPEKVAQTIVMMIDKDGDGIADAICVMFDNCSGCPCGTYPVPCDIRIASLSTDEFTEWLRSEVQSDE